MLNLPGSVSADYILSESMTQDQLVDDLHNRIDFAISLFKSIPKQKGWLNQDENQALVSKCITKFEELAQDGKLVAKDARRVYAAVVEGGFGSLFNNITCRFPKNEDMFFNKMLFNSISENSRQNNFLKMLEWGNGSLGFKDSEYQSMMYVSEWLKTGKVNFSGGDTKNLPKVIGELLLITGHQKIDAMSKQLMEIVMKQFSLEEKVDVALYEGTRDMLSIANSLLEGYCQGIKMILSADRSCRILVTDTTALTQAWETDKKERVENLFQVFSKHGLNVYFRLAVNLNSKDGEILESLFSIIGPCVQRFSVIFSEVEDKALPATVGGVIALLCDMQNLEYFHICGKGSNLSSDHYLQVSAICPAVSSISIDDCAEVQLEFIHGMIERSGIKLKHLRLNGCGMINDTVAEKIREHCPNIEAFFLDTGDVDGDPDISQEAIVQMFGDCKKLKTLQFWNSENAPAPPEEKNPYDLGVINVLMEEYPKRVISINYNFREHT